MHTVLFDPDIDGLPSSQRSMGAPFPARWSNAKSGLVGWLTGLGHTSKAIADELGDGTTGSTIRRMWRLWGIGYKADQRLGLVPAQVPLTGKERAMLAWRAEKVGLTSEEWLRRICSAAIRDGLYEAIVDESQPQA